MSLCFPVSSNTHPLEWKLLFNRIVIMSRSLTTHLSRLWVYLRVCQLSSKDWAEFQHKVSTVQTTHAQKTQSHMSTHTLLSTADRAVRMLLNNDSCPLSSHLPVTYGNIKMNNMIANESITCQRVQFTAVNMWGFLVFFMLIQYCWALTC